VQRLFLNEPPSLEALVAKLGEFSRGQETHHRAVRGSFVMENLLQLQHLSFQVYPRLFSREELLVESKAPRRKGGGDLLIPLTALLAGEAEPVAISPPLHWRDADSVRDGEDLRERRKRGELSRVIRRRADRSSRDVCDDLVSSIQKVV
jgi:hypothetical protein